MLSTATKEPPEGGGLNPKVENQGNRFLNIATETFRLALYDRVTDYVQFKSSLSRVAGLPVAMLCIVLGLTALRTGSRGFVELSLLSKAELLHRDYGVSFKLPNFWVFCLKRDLRSAHAEYMRKLGEIRQSESKTISVANRLDNLDKHLSAFLKKHSTHESLAAIIGRALGSSSDQEKIAAIVAVMDYERKQGKKLSKVPSSTHGSGGGKGTGNRRSLLASFERPEPAKYKTLTVEEVFLQALPQEEISPLVPEGLDCQLLQVITCVLLAPGAGDSRFGAHYRSAGMILQMVRSKYHSWFDKNLSEKDFDKTIRWMLAEGVILAKTKPNDTMYSLSAHANSARTEAGRELIRMILRCADRLKT